MLIRTVVAPLLGANCYLIGEGDRCVVVDPGGGVTAAVEAELAAAGWEPTAVLLTHGHLDHTHGAGELAARHRLPVWIHAGDAYRLADPFGTLGELGPALAATMPTPHPVSPLTFEADAEVAGMRALHCPGHTEGATVFLAEGTAFTGDVLFAGSIGRTDLPGGDVSAMAATLRRLAQLDESTAVLPGHGPPTTIGAELESNPFFHRT